MTELTKKVVLIGSEGVGKTSLSKRFVYSIFDDDYLSSIGVKISKKKLQIRKDLILNLVIWDIAGEMLDSKLYRSYLGGSEGAIFVFDVSRRQTYKSAEADFQIIMEENPDISIELIGNKNDLEFNEEDYPETNFFTSAKSGEGVDALFERLSMKMLDLIE